jgi:hypothetical protein
MVSAVGSDARGTQSGFVSTSDPGGGASRSTDPAAGSSAATDVSLREFVAVRLEALDRHLGSEIQALRRETEQANKNSERAIAVAADEAKERLSAHNGLIEQMRQQAELFATRESLDNFKHERHQALDSFKDETDRRFGRLERFQAMLIGGFLFVSFVGVANLVKVWSG